MAEELSCASGVCLHCHMIRSANAFCAAHPGHVARDAGRALKEIAAALGDLIAYSVHGLHLSESEAERLMTQFIADCGRQIKVNAEAGLTTLTTHMPHDPASCN